MKLIMIFLILSSLSLFASEDHGHDEEKEGHEEAVELPAGVVSFHDEEAEFTLKPNVLKNFEISSVKVVIAESGIRVPDSSVVRSLDKTTIFERQDNTFRSVEVKVIKSENKMLIVQPMKKLEGQEVVDKGANFLQTVLLSLEEGPSEGHGH